MRIRGEWLGCILIAGMCASAQVKQHRISIADLPNPAKSCRLESSGVIYSDDGQDEVIFAPQPGSNMPPPALNRSLLLKGVNTFKALAVDETLPAPKEAR